MITFAQVATILKNHGWALNQQTGAEKGSSFLEAFGIKDYYDKKTVYEWLGY